MAGNVRIKTENMKLLRDFKEKTGVPIEFLVNKAVKDMYGCKDKISDLGVPGGGSLVGHVEVVKDKAPVKRFVKPTLMELAIYFQEKGSDKCNDDADGFMNHYESNGWKVGKNPMKDWKAAVRNWLRGKKKSSPYMADKEAKAEKRSKSLDDFFGKNTDVMGVIGRE